MSNKKYKQSPIFYMGNKYRLINKGLIDLFPKKIRNFWDIFCGSGVVSMNVEAEMYVLNDRNKTILNLLKMFKLKEPEEIIKEMEFLIKEHCLLKGYSNKDTRVTEEYKAQSKKNYFAFRKHYNDEPSLLKLYLLTYYCNNNNIRFNSEGKFNMPTGSQYFNKERHTQKIKNGCDFFSKSGVILNNQDYKNLPFKNIGENDFVYFDPPYSNTLAIYNEQQGWRTEDDLELFKICEELNSRGVKWGLSNVFENKGSVNQHLIDWCKKNNWNVCFFEGFSYSSFGKGNAKTKEVYIYNY